MSFGITAAGVMAASAAVGAGAAVYSATKATKKAPSTPNATETTQAQSAADLETARLNAQLNRYNQDTPWGDLNWTNDGNDNWTSAVNLDPQQQYNLDSGEHVTSDAFMRADGQLEQSVYRPSASPSLEGSRLDYEGRLTDPSAMIEPAQGLATTAQGNFGDAINRAGQVAGTEFNYDSASAMPVANDETRQRIEDALYNRSTSRLDPQFAQREARLKSDLTNQGITQGSEAWNTEAGNFGRDQNDAYQTAMNEAILAGGNEQTRDYNLGMSARQQGVTEANTLRNQPFNEANAMANYNTTAQTDLARALGLENSYETSALNLGNAANTQDWTNRSNIINEQYAGRNQVLNELNAVRTGSQTQQPQFQATNTATNVPASNLSSNIYGSYNADMAKYNAGVSSNNALVGGLASVGAGIASNPNYFKTS